VLVVETEFPLHSPPCKFIGDTVYLFSLGNFSGIGVIDLLSLWIVVFAGHCASLLHQIESIRNARAGSIKKAVDVTDSTQVVLEALRRAEKRHKASVQISTRTAEFSTRYSCLRRITLSEPA
jgi:uncharacterized iron-regulated membrane protein